VCRLRSGSPAIGAGGGKGVAVAGTEPGGRHRPARAAWGASWRDWRSGTRVHCCGATKYMDAAPGGVRAGQRVRQSAWLPVRTAWRSPAGGRRRGWCALWTGLGSGRTRPATAVSPTVSPSLHPPVHPTHSRTTRVFCLVRPLVLTSPGMPTTPLPSTLLGRTWGKGTVRRRREAAREGSSADFCLRRALAGPLAVADASAGGMGGGGLPAASATMDSLHSSTSQGRLTWRTRQAR
jgi:hypothetical protein